MPDFLYSVPYLMTWTDIFDMIIQKLGPKFYEWESVDFKENEVMTIHHSDGKQTARVHLKGIEVSEPAIAGGWLTTLRITKVVVFATAHYKRINPEEVTGETELLFADNEGDTRVAFYNSLFQELRFGATLYPNKITVHQIIGTFRNIDKIARKGI